MAVADRRTPRTAPHTPHPPSAMADRCKVYVGRLDRDARESELEHEFSRFGRIDKVWMARNPPGFAYVYFEDERDAADAVDRLDGKHGWRVEFSTGPRSDRGGGSGRCKKMG